MRAGPEMGFTGPVGKRPSERLGHSHNVGGHMAGITQVTTGTQELFWPAPLDEWHEQATQWYLSLQESGQSQFYELSDVTLAHFIAGQMSDYLLVKFRASRSEMLRGLLSGMSLLGSTEYDRRRMGIELVKQEPKEDPATAAMSTYRKMLTKPKIANSARVTDSDPSDESAQSA